MYRTFPNLNVEPIAEQEILFQQTCKRRPASKRPVPALARASAAALAPSVQRNEPVYARERTMYSTDESRAIRVWLYAYQQALKYDANGAVKEELKKFDFWRRCSYIERQLQPVFCSGHRDRIFKERFHRVD